MSCVNRWSNGDDKTLDGVLARLGQIARKLFTADRLTVSVSEKADDALIDRLISSFPAGDGKAPPAGLHVPVQSRQAQRGKGDQVVQKELPDVQEVAALQVLQRAVHQAGRQTGPYAEGGREQHGDD